MKTISRLLPVALLLVCVAPAHAQRVTVVPKDSEKFLGAFKDAVAKARQGTVRILCEGN